MRAAQRLGFVHEGTLRKHQVFEGRRRDTAVFSLLDEEWFDNGGVKDALEAWLGEGNFDERGAQRRRLEAFRVKG